MFQYKGCIQGFLIICSIISIAKCIPQDNAALVKPGRYVPEIYGGQLGKYIPDNSGKYNHVPRPYDGGYGDRGIRYIHDSSGKLIRVSSDGQPDSSQYLLGPKDHLHFMIDFNYDKNGWEIIKFEWLRDDNKNYNYKYFNQNQLWNSDDNNPHGASEYDTAEQSNHDSKVHIDGEYHEENGYNYSYSDEKSHDNSNNLKQAIKEVLDYIEFNILPTL